MTTVGQLVFCTMCNNILPPSTGSSQNVLKCDVCETINQDVDLEPIVMISKPSDFPSPLRNKLSNVKTIERHMLQTEAKIQQDCPKCGRTEVKYSAVQLRSADEGSTIFYTCDCGYKWSENN